MVPLSGLSDPLQAVTVAYYRMFEVGVGVLSALIVANLLQDCTHHLDGDGGAGGRLRAMGRPAPQPEPSVNHRK